MYDLAFPNWAFLFCVNILRPLASSEICQTNFLQLLQWQLKLHTYYPPTPQHFPKPLKTVLTKTRFPKSKLYPSKRPKSGLFLSQSEPSSPKTPHFRTVSPNPQMGIFTVKDLRSRKSWTLLRRGRSISTVSHR